MSCRPRRQSLGKSPVLGAAFGLFSVWWCVSLIAYLVTGQVWSGEDWISMSSQALIGVAGGSVFGIAATAALVMMARQWRMAQLTGDNVRGVVCTIGELPISFERPVEAKEMADKASLRLPDEDSDPDQKIDIDWMEKWFEKYEADYPDHAKLMRAVGRVLNSKPTLPAACKRKAKGLRKWQYGHDQHNHGNHTLVEHSWVCASVGIWIAENGFEYDGVQFVETHRGVDFIAKKDKGYITLKNERYKFEKFDPLIGLICFAHDVGKIETFRQNKDGTVEVIEPAHDSVGARMLSRMDEFWALPYEDRMTLTLSIGHYHKPGQMPLRRDSESPQKAEALSDRTMAMLELVITADEQTSKIENKKDDDEGKNKPKEIVEEDYKVDLWEAFQDLLNEAQRVHHEPNKFKIGQKNTTPEGAIITLKEGDMRKALLEKMELKKSVKESVTSSGSVQITEDLLEVLEDRGCLITERGGLKVEAKKAIWRVEFLGKDKQKVGEVIANWPFAIMINPDIHFPRLANSQDAQSMPRVTGLADKEGMGAPKKARADQPADVLTQGPLQNEDGTFIIPDGKKNKKPKQKEAVPAAVRLEAVPETEPNQPASVAVARPAADAKPKLHIVPTVSTDQLGEERVHDEPKVVSSGSGSAWLLDDEEPLPPGKAAEAAKDVPAVVVDTTSNASEAETEAPQAGDSNSVLRIEAEQPKAAGAGAAEKLLAVQRRLQEKAAGEVVETSTVVPVANAVSLSDTQVETVRMMKKGLLRLDEMEREKAIVGDVMEDGRIGYSFEAINAIVPMMKEHLQDERVVRRLMAAVKEGPDAPVAIVRRASGVALLVLNRKSIDKAMRMR